MANLSRNQARMKKHHRIRGKISGTAKLPRLNVFKSLKNFEAQIIDDVNGKTLASSSTRSLKLSSGGNIKAAQVVAQDLSQKIKVLKLKQLIFDRSGYIYHGRVKAFAEALRAEGVKL